MPALAGPRGTARLTGRALTWRLRKIVQSPVGSGSRFRPARWGFDRRDLAPRLARLPGWPFCRIVVAGPRIASCDLWQRSRSDRRTLGPERSMPRRSVRHPRRLTVRRGRRRSSLDVAVSSLVQGSRIVARQKCRSRGCRSVVIREPADRRCCGNMLILASLTCQMSLPCGLVPSGPLIFYCPDLDVIRISMSPQSASGCGAIAW